ncbi:MAG TPA: hypothetical protein VGL81_25835 [Polyangiaceae bacterium]|jgi:hypothetical protein
MNQRALALCALAAGLASVAFSATACRATSSSPAAEDDADAASPSLSQTAAGSTDDGGTPESSAAEAGADAGMDVATDAGMDVTTVDASGEDSGPDGNVVDAPIAPEAATDATICPCEAGMDAGSPEAATEAAAAEAGVPCVNLTVLNYEVWCSVSVNGGDASVVDAETVCVPPGTEQLAATAVEFFELGPAPWHDTAGDMGDGDPGTVTGSGPSAVDSTTVVVGATPKCIWVCCPFDDGVGCPTTDQCP